MMPKYPIYPPVDRILIDAGYFLKESTFTYLDRPLLVADISTYELLARIWNLWATSPYFFVMEWLEFLKKALPRNKKRLG